MTIEEIEEMKSELEELRRFVLDLTAKLEAVTFQEKVSPIALYDVSVRFGISYEELMEMFGHVVPSTMSEVTLTREQIEAIRDFDKVPSDKALRCLIALALERLDMKPRDIADAPRDGTEILAYWDDEWVKTYWAKRNGFEGWQLPSGRPIKAYAPETWKPTHFIALSSLQKPKGA